MSLYQIAVVVGSLRKESFNRKLATAVARLEPSDFTGADNRPFLQGWMHRHVAWVKKHAA